MLLFVAQAADRQEAVQVIQGMGPAAAVTPLNQGCTVPVNVEMLLARTPDASVAGPSYGPVKTLNMLKDCLWTDADRIAWTCKARGTACSIMVIERARLLWHRVEALLGNCPKSNPSVKCGIRCYQCFVRAV